ncbi:MAG TPA: hypothetical protein VH255_02900 [Verrucomicrobiae bacterium]|nr:hypothetical protein [Verrucomicrobiae bacterium]
MKKLVAIIFSIALIAAQMFAFADTAPTTVVAKKNNCVCTAKCCASKTSAAQEKIPAVPTTASSLKNIQTISWQTIVLVSVSVSPASLSAASAPSFVSASAVPFFMRDCAFLI